MKCGENLEKIGKAKLTMVRWSCILRQYYQFDAAS